MYTGNVGKYKCIECGKRYTSPGALSYHTKSTDCSVKYECDRCKKVFQSEAKLNIHKNKKIKCDAGVKKLVKSETSICEFCDNVFSNKSSLTRHIKICSKKKEMVTKGKIITETIESLSEHISQQVKEQIEEAISKSMDKLLQPTSNRNTNVNGNNNLTVNGNVQVNNTSNYINNYLSPNTDGLRFTREHLARTSKVLEEFIKLVYCNRNRPENQSVKVINKKEEEIAFMDEDGWIVESKESTKHKLTQIHNKMRELGEILINGANGPYGGTDAEFNKLPEVYRDKLQKFNNGNDEQRMSIEEVLNIFIRDHMCKSIK